MRGSQQSVNPASWDLMPSSGLYRLLLQSHGQTNVYTHGKSYFFFFLRKKGDRGDDDQVSIYEESISSGLRGWDAERVRKKGM